MIYRVFEFLIIVFQSVIITHFLIKCLGVRTKEKRPMCEYAVGITITLIYFEILNRIASPESIGLFLYFFISIFFSAFLLKGSITEKVFYNLLMISGITFASLLGSGIAGMFEGKEYLSTVFPHSMSRYIADILTQVILCMIFMLTVKLKSLLNLSTFKYMGVLCLVPLVSVMICCLIVYRENQNHTTEVIYTMLAVAGVFALSIINLLMLTFGQKTHTQRMQEYKLLNAYEQKNAESIKAIKVENDKCRHEIKKVLILIAELLDDGEYQKAKEFLNKFVSERDVLKKSIIYSDNLVLNYLLNRKIKQCEDGKIDITCFVNGVMDGIEDADLYILLENLLDNAMEASLQTEKRKMELSIYADDSHIDIEIGNSAKDDVLVINPDMHTTKKDKLSHGFGLQNVKDIVKRYNGLIEYQSKERGYVLCKVKLEKITVHA